MIRKGIEERWRSGLVGGNRPCKMTGGSPRRECPKGNGIKPPVQRLPENRAMLSFKEIRECKECRGEKGHHEEPDGIPERYKLETHTVEDNKGGFSNALIMFESLLEQ